MIILTCKVGNKIINTFEYDNEQIRKWSNKGILKCPVCNGEMIYRNGEFKIAHFAHKLNECDLKYVEPETLEHLQGKKILYEWLKSQDGVTNLKLEAWIPETKQRPDIYFEYNNERFVIEYQCSPIATNYKERHRLYELAGVKDIWILGIEKYEISQFINKILKGGIVELNTKTIERECLDSKFKLLYLKNQCMLTPYINSIKRVTKVVKFKFDFISIPIKEMTMNSLLSDKNLDLEKEKYEENMKKRINISNKRQERQSMISKINKTRKINNIKNNFITKISSFIDNIKKYDSDNYYFYKNKTRCFLNFIYGEYDDDKVVFELKEKYSKTNDILIPIFINEDSTMFFDKNTTSWYYTKYNYINEEGIVSINDVNLESFTKPFRGRRGGIGWRRIDYYRYSIDSVRYSDIDSDFIKKLRFYKSVNCNTSVLIVDDFYKKPKGKKIYLKNFDFTEKYVADLFKRIKNEKRIQVILPLKKDKFNKRVRYLEYELLEAKRVFNIAGYHNVEIYWG